MLEPLRASHQSQAFLMCSGLHTWGHLVTVPSTCDAQADCLMEELSGTAKEAPRSQVQEGPSADQSELQGPSTPDQVCISAASQVAALLLVMMPGASTGMEMYQNAATLSQWEPHCAGGGCYGNLL